MRNSGLLKWAQNNKNNKQTNGKSQSWVHSPDTLLKGHVAYLVKFLGSTEVDQPKGIEVVKQGIQKLKFSHQLKKSEGSKTQKVELTISVDGVAIQDPKTKKMLHQYALQRISYCADDKAEKRFFSFIAKEDEGNKHTCFVFVSDKLAEEITLTIGQAFELAYKRFIETSGRDAEVKKQLIALQKKIENLEQENSELKTRLRDVANIKGQQDIQAYLAAKRLTDICQVISHTEDQNGNENPKLTNGMSSPTSEMKPENSLISLEGAAEQLDNFTLDDLNDGDFNPRAEANTSEDDDFQFEARPSPTVPAAVATPKPVALSPPPALPPRDSQKASKSSLLQNQTSNPFASGSDLFGMDSFNIAPGSQNGFQARPTFTLDELDPLKN